jgi:nitrogen regulatory protein P-II 2
MDSMLGFVLPGARKHRCPSSSSASARAYYRGNKGVIRLLSKVKLEIAVNEDFVEPTVAAILKTAHTGRIGDGKIFVLPLEECYRIRTRESGNEAIGP